MACVEELAMEKMTVAGSFQAPVRIWSAGESAEGYFHLSEAPEEPFPYRGLDGLLLALDELMDRQNRLRRPERLRSIAGVHRESPRLTYRPSVQAGFTVSLRIFFRQHYSMQGELCLQSGQKVCFRSALELLHLLRQVVEQMDGEEGKTDYSV